MVQAQILELLERLRRELGLSMIIITHDLSVIAETCDRVMVMYAGKVAEEGPVAEDLVKPRHPYTQMLLTAFPNIQAERRSLEVIPGSPPDLRTPPTGCRFHPRCPLAMAVCSEVVPPEVAYRQTASGSHATCIRRAGDGRPVGVVPTAARASRCGIAPPRPRAAERCGTTRAGPPDDPGRVCQGSRADDSPSHLSGADHGLAPDQPPGEQP